MEKYIAFKSVEAEECTKADYNFSAGYTITPEQEKEDGYRVRYPDGYVSWSPKEAFDKSHLEIGDDNTITEEIVSDFIVEEEVMTLGDKTTVVKATLKNGFVIVASSSCVDEKNYDEGIGAMCCREEIEDKIWGYLGFLLSTALKGIGG